MNHIIRKTLSKYFGRWQIKSDLKFLHVKQTLQVIKSHISYRITDGTGPKLSTMSLVWICGLVDQSWWHSFLETRDWLAKNPMNHLHLIFRFKCSKSNKHTPWLFLIQRSFYYHSRHPKSLDFTSDEVFAPLLAATLIGGLIDGEGIRDGAGVKG